MSTFTIDPFIPSHCRKRPIGKFFPYMNKTHYDFSRYGIYKEVEVNYSVSFLEALKAGGLSPEKTEKLKHMINHGSVPKSQIAEICDELQIKITLRQDGQKNNYKYGVGEETFELGLIENHYFIYETTNNTRYSLEHYDEIKEHPRANEISHMEGKKYKYVAGRQINSMDVFRILLANPDTLIQKYSFNELASTPYFKKYDEEILILDYDEKQLHSIENNIQEKIKIQAEKNNAVNIFADFETLVQSHEQIINSKLITSKKYKTIGELLKSPIKSIIQVSNNEKNDVIKLYLYDWLYKNHYSSIKMTGNLTTRIKNISNKPCYYYIMKECFNNIDCSKFKTTKNILNNECIEIIKIMHSIDSSLTGTFLDYLVRRIICEITQQTFYDSRAESQIYNNNQINLILNNEDVWTFIINDDFNLWSVFKNPSTKSECIIGITCGDNFIVKAKKNEWLNIEYKDYTGWVRYLIPKCVDFANKEFDENDYIENKYIQRVEPNTSPHICSHGCIRRFEKLVFHGKLPNYIPECKIYECLNICYEKSKNTELYASIDIMKELFITSLSHTISFGGCPEQNKVNKILGLIKSTTNIEDVFYLPLKKMCKELVKENETSNILLNPILGFQIPALNNKNIPSDCDIVINDILYDMKCTRGDNSIYEILQLLGYTSLLNCVPQLNKKINKMSIINLLQGHIVNYDISYITTAQMVNYLKILTK